MCLRMWRCRSRRERDRRAPAPCGRECCGRRRLRSPQPLAFLAISQQWSQQPSPRQLSRPSLIARPATMKAASGSSHQRPKSVLPRRPTKTAAAKIGTKDVLRSLAGGRRRVELRAESMLHPSEEGHNDQAADGQADAQVARLGLGVDEQLVEGVASDIGNEQPEADGHRLLRSPLGGLRQRAPAIRGPSNSSAAATCSRLRGGSLPRTPSPFIGPQPTRPGGRRG